MTSTAQSPVDRVRGRHWMFTFNNPDPECLDEPATWFDENRRPSYCVWQAERGEQGTLHLQGYCVFPVRVPLTYLKKWLVGHWTRCDGNVAECIAYCSKNDTRVDGPFEFGIPPVLPERGKRSDIIDLREEVRDGATDLSIIENDTVVAAYARYPQFVQTLRRVYDQNDRSEQTKCIILYGPPGTGKTTLAHKIALDQGLSVFCLPQKQTQDASPWWNGYDGQECVIIDEMSGSVMRADLFCNLIGEYPLVLPTKNGHVSFKAKLVIFTSNLHPSDWWSSAVLARNPGVTRRMQKPLARVIHVTEVIRNPRVQGGIDLESIDVGGLPDVTIHDSHDGPVFAQDVFAHVYTHVDRQ